MVEKSATSTSGARPIEVLAHREGVVGEDLLAVGGQARQGTARTARLVLFDVLHSTPHRDTEKDQIGSGVNG